MRCIDLTTLEGAGHPGQGARALRPRAAPRPGRPVASRRSPRCACTASLVAEARAALEGTAVQGGVGRRARSRPGRATWSERLEEIRRAVADGADEIDIVLNRGALLAGRLRRGARRGGRVQGGLRARPPEDDPRDRRARLLRDGPPGLDGRHGGGQRRHQDLHRQAARVRHPARWRCAWPRRSATSPTRPAARWA